ncbi:MAG: hypothetical protein ACWGNI_00415 [Desulfobacterales bacterium]
MKKLDKPILAEGEVTGHSHTLIGDVDVFINDIGEREFSINEPADLVHEEHKKITIPEGEYISDKVVEFDHFEQAARIVMD